MEIKKHIGEIFPGTKKRIYAYQDEICHPGCYIIAWESMRPEAGKGITKSASETRKCEFFIVKHTDNMMAITLRIHRNDVVKQRIEKGFATESEDYTAYLSFGELMNRIFGPGCDVFNNDEAFPDSIKDAMKKVYKEF